MSESRFRTKIELRAEKPFNLVDKLTGRSIEVPRGVDWQLELLRTLKGALVDLSLIHIDAADE